MAGQAVDLTAPVPMGALGTFLTVIFVIVCIALMLLILMQSGRSSGMGIMGGSNTAFGASSVDVITKVTGWFTVAFIVLSLSIAVIKSRTTGTDEIQEQMQNSQSLTPPVNSTTEAPAEPAVNQ